MIQSPLNYTGGKYKLLPQIKPLFPEDIDTFVDMFCGGCNVGINVKAKQYWYIDNNEALISLFSVMQRIPSETLICKIEHIIKEYGLSDVKRNGYEYYECNSRDGLSKFNREAFERLKKEVNALYEHNDDYYIKLYVLIVYAFNNQIRFNRKGEFNLPPGKRDFNRKMCEKVRAFVDSIQAQEASFFAQDFEDIRIEELTDRDLVYADPPYLITCASYNEQGGWSEKDEYRLLNMLNRLDGCGVRFALSNVLESKGKTNEILLEWIHNNSQYKMIDLNYDYNNSSYQRRNKDKKTREILVINY